MSALLISAKTSSKALFQRVQRSNVQTSRPVRQLRVNAYKLTFQFPDGAQKTIDCDANTYVMDAADAANLELPNLCRSGTCCTCACKVVSGEYDISDNEYLEPAVAERGFALMCSTKPKSDLMIMTHQEQEVYNVAAYRV